MTIKIKFKSRTPTEDEVLAVAEQIISYKLFESDELNTPTDAAKYCKIRLGKRKQEVFAAIFLDTRHRAIGYKELFTGTIDGCTVHPREVVRLAIEYNAAAIIFAHNHPSGNATPSMADRTITIRLRDALALIDVRVLDHFVIGDGEPVSMAQLGYI